MSQLVFSVLLCPDHSLDLCVQGPTPNIPFKATSRFKNKYLVFNRETWDGLGVDRRHGRILISVDHLRLWSIIDHEYHIFISIICLQSIVVSPRARFRIGHVMSLWKGLGCKVSRYNVGVQQIDFLSDRCIQRRTRFNSKLSKVASNQTKLEKPAKKNFSIRFN
jgi:hypothetical protein